VLLAWLSSFPMDRVAHRLVEKQTLRPIEDALFAFPWWLPLGVVIFAVLVTTLSALYPARRAARVDPIAALRHA
jgi:ABC-type antimicrobial peptide transport system permease subunit